MGYHHFRYDTNGQEVSVTYCSKNAWLDGCGSSSIMPYKIIKTSFDWEGYDKPYWWGQPDEILEHETVTLPPTFEDIISGGESNSVEFKPTTTDTTL